MIPIDVYLRNFNFSYAGGGSQSKEELIRGRYEIISNSRTRQYSVRIVTGLPSSPNH